jgi:hypothetical protein
MGRGAQPSQDLKARRISEYGVSFKAALDTGGVLVSDKINLELDVSAINEPRIADARNA